VQAFHTVTRRSFLARVAGGGVDSGSGLSLGASGVAALLTAEPATRRMVVDADPRDPARPPRTHASMAPPSRPTDQDSGPRSDAAGTGGHARRSNAAAPRERFVVCPGNPRCPA
jgi:hypothetical protein